MDSVAIVFDLDGTIWDSWPWYAKILADFSEVDETQLRQEIFDGANVVSLCRKYNITNSQFIGNCKRQIADLELHSGVVETLSELRQRNIPLGVFTSLPKWIAHPLLSEKKIVNFFATVIASTQGQPRKPNPAGLVRALKQLNLSETQNGVYVGDSVDDSLAARNAGVKFAWVNFGYDQEPPEYRVACLGKFEDILTV